ncbi:Ig-like domain-containing protein [Fulvivirgaceae bacterium BMA12]|uniref:Ig-like domain-containing protein n=1 Tax=Agaribacillus aureus TaxID=3051825 RepID=A0ABT8L5V7_9BACT|nr:Ig-like domain-containing protein [Fulvivirgaceae bacterium BMA12]
MKHNKLTISFLLVLMCSLTAYSQTVNVTGTLQKWHKITVSLTLPGGNLTETANTFRNTRMDVIFNRPGGGSIRVPGFFAADGDAANTNATQGKVLKAYLRPDQTGTWTYRVLYYTGTDVSISTVGSLPSPVHDLTGTVGNVTASNKTAPDFRSKGRLQYQTTGTDNERRYLQFAETGEYFLKLGPDSPENLLDYNDFDFDDTRNGCALCTQHFFNPHAGNFNSGDPTWDGGKGQNLIGALNYLKNQQMNSISMSLFGGDDKNVFPWTTVNSKFIYDVSKLEQWEIVFDHAEKSGLLLHFKLAENENWNALNTTTLNVYYREMVARFSHHLAVEWNISEEYRGSASSALPRINWLASIDPWQNHRVIHTYPGEHSKYQEWLNLNANLTGASIQSPNTNNYNLVFSGPAGILTWINNSKNDGTPWVVASDEQNPGSTGVYTSEDINNSNVTVQARKRVLWKTLIAGGAGVMWYGGGQGDFKTENFNRFSTLFNWTRYAILDFFEGNNLEYWKMVNSDNLVSGSGNHCLAEAGQAYAIYLENGGSTNLNLNGQSGTFDVRWFNPRSGGALLNGNVTSVTGGGTRSLGNPPNTTTSDWAILVTAQTGTDPVSGVSVSPTTVSLAQGQTASLIATVAPPTAANKSVTWSSDNAAVATVSASGLVTALSQGNATITVTTVDGGFTATSAITVTASSIINLNPTNDAYLQGSTAFNNADLRVETNNRVSYLMFDLSGISGTINSAELTLAVGSDTGNGPINVDEGNSSNWTETNLSNSNKPASAGQLGTLNTTYASNQSYTWTLNAAAISGGGNLSLIVAQTSGNDVSFASKENGNASKIPVLTLNVSTGNTNVPVTGVSVTPTTLALEVGQTGNLTATIAPANATDPSVSWSSDNTAVATVNESGVVSAVSAGTATITATTTDGGFTDTSAITVSDPPSGGDITLGNSTTTDATHDGWNSNMVINESDTYTNNTGSSQQLQVDDFVFYAWREADPVTPFIVKVNGDNDFTVLAVGTTRTSSAYNVGENTFAFNTGNAKVITVANGETIATGFLDANADGSGGSIGSVIPFDENNPADQLWYSGGPASGNSGSVTEGAAPGAGTNTITTLSRNYRYKMLLSVSVGTSQPVTGVSVAPATLALQTGQTGNLTATVIPANATNQSVNWSSDNTAVASVNTTGVVTAVAVGGANITVTTVDGGFTASSAVTVTSAGGTPVTTTLEPIHDAYLQGATNFNNTILRVESGNRVSYLMFDLSGVNGTITDAELKMTCNSDAGNGNININLGNSNNWTESNLSNANKPGMGALLGNLNSTYNIGTTYTWTLSAGSLNGGGNVSLIATQTSGGDAAFASKENTLTAPQLVITYTPASSARIAGNLETSGSSDKTRAKSFEKTKAIMFPNPTSGGHVTLYLGGHEGITRVNVFDAMGKLVHKTTTDTGKLYIDANIFPGNGLYLFNVRSTNKSELLRLIVR